MLIALDITNGKNVRMLKIDTNIIERFLRTFFCKFIKRDRLFQLSLLLAGVFMITLASSSVFWLMLTLSILLGATVGLGNPLTLLTVTDGISAKDRSGVLALRVMGN